MEQRSAVILLYSASPRRKELLEKAGLSLRIRPVDADEEPHPGLSPPQVVRDIAERKLQIGLSTFPPAGQEWALAADTLVEGPEGLLMGKPSDAGEAMDMIRALSGNRHQVHTGYALRVPEAPGSSAVIRSGVHSTVVFFRTLSEFEMQSYVASGEWNGAAGAYRIQDRGEILVSRIEGLRSTVAGLPLGPLYGILSELSYPFS